MAVRTTLTITVKPGSEDDFEDVWRKIADVVKHERGNLRQALSRDPQDARVFVVTSDWDSRETFSAFEKSPEQDDLTAPIRELRESARMTVHDLLIQIEGEH
jgi:heme-degrading monooxygenase HmoA